jgi:hypothetical protein
VSRPDESRRFRAWLPLVGCLAALASAAEPPPREQFAYSIPLWVPDASPVVSLPLPIPVYRDCVDAGLRDLRVLNGAGEVVPYALWRTPATSPRAADAVRIPLFPLRGDTAQAPPALQLNIVDGRTQIAMQGAIGGDPGIAGPIVAWLMDARAIDAPIQSLTWEWSADAPDFSLNVQLEASDDLGSWRTVEAAAPLARLRYGGEMFERRTATFRPTRAKFWRATSYGAGDLPELTAVSAMPVAGDVAVEHELAEADGIPQAGRTDEYLFDLGAQLPVDSVELELPDINTVAEVEYFARRSVTEDWRSVARGAVYRLQGAGDELRSPALPAGGELRRLWRVTVDPRGGGIGRGIPRLRAAWIPDQVVFVTRGGGPFQLVYGSYAAPAAEVALGSLLPARDTAPFAAGDLPVAQAGEPEEAGGVERLEPPPRERPWRAWVLWAALLAGVATLAMLAWNLARQMRATN